MARKKVYTKEQILVAAQELVIMKGFSSLTARSVANYMGISTQPIYLEFKNMNELKETLLSAIYDELKRTFFLEKLTANVYFDFGMGLIEFAKTNQRLFLALYVDKHEYGERVQEKSFSLFYELVAEGNKNKSISIEKLKAIHLNILIRATGVAILNNSGLIVLEEEQITNLFEQAI